MPMSRVGLKLVLAVGGIVILCGLVTLSVRYRTRGNLDAAVAAQTSRTVLNREPRSSGIHASGRSNGSLGTDPSSGARSATSARARSARTDVSGRGSTDTLISDDLNDEVTTGAAIKGRIRDVDGKVVAGVLVTLSRPETTSSPARRMTTTTDAAGAYLFEKQDPGRALVSVHPDATSDYYPPAPVCVGLTESTEVSGVDFQLGRGLSIIGFVHSDRAEPVAGAYVGADLLHQPVPPRHMGSADTGHTCPEIVSGGGQDRMLKKTAMSDPIGYFEINGIRPEAKAVSISASADGCQSTSFEPISPFRHVQDITLKTVAEVLIVAVDGVASAPLTRFRYRFATSWGWGVGHHSFMNWTEPSMLEQPGEAHVRDVPPGEWDIFLEELAETGTSTGRTAHVLYTVTGRDDVVRLSVGVKRSITGVVLDPSGNKVGGVQVRAYPFDNSGGRVKRPPTGLLGLIMAVGGGDGVVASVTSARDGTFEVQGMTPGSYEIVGETTEWLNARRVVADVPASGEAEPVLVQLVPAATIYGKVTGPDGSPMARALVRDHSRQSSGDSEAVARTRSDGFYIMRKLAPDFYKIGVTGHEEILQSVALKPGEEREINFDLSGRIQLSGAITGDTQFLGQAILVYLREEARGWPELETGYNLNLDRKSGRYTVSVPPGELILWTFTSSRGTMMIEKVVLPAEPREQTRDFQIKLADALVVVLDPNSQPYDEGTVCFDQRLGSFIGKRMFSMSLKRQQSFFPNLVAGEYRVNFLATDSTYSGQSDWVKIEPGRENTITVNARALNRGKAIGTWNSKTISTVYRDHRFPAQDVIDGSGTYQAMILYEWGSDGVRIQSVGLMENGVEVARDVHEGWSGTGKRDHIYTLSLPSYKAGAEYALVVTMQSSGGTMSQGTVFLSRAAE